MKLVFLRLQKCPRFGNIESSSGVAKRGRGGRSTPGGTFMGAALWAMLWVINLQRLY